MRKLKIWLELSGCWGLLLTLRRCRPWVSMGREGSRRVREGGVIVEVAAKFRRAGARARPDPKPMSSSDEGRVSEHTRAMRAARLRYKGT